jgi:hypothetical protein
MAMAIEIENAKCCSPHTPLVFVLALLARILVVADVSIPCMSPLILATFNTAWPHDLLLQYFFVTLTQLLSLLGAAVRIIGIVGIVPWPAQVDIDILPAFVTSHRFHQKQASVPFIFL